MSKYIIDRIEDDLAICEDTSTGDMVEIEIYELPEYIEVGDVIAYENGEYVIDDEETGIRDDIIKDKMDDVWDE